MVKGNEHCVKDCEKQGPCECCTEWKSEIRNKKEYEPEVVIQKAKGKEILWIVKELMKHLKIINV